ncbi:hypothetical protein IEC97_27990 [Neobacillus cucumis]|uniref:hypothetical protein n=1 Tax=Neobacillus cucumis TaxID=1740721 RepID=UPI0018E00363|nr:hypothetical protein [Neobacillus cucumis]MBI0581159.1 hypothetical protein [Neobacillus cucumis]WHY91481.1 hypothetical protein QNK12_28345 [Neobacillus cucumis]
MHQNSVEKKEKGISAKTVRLSIEVPECIRDEFRDAVEKNGKCMKDVLRLYMQKYIWKQSELQRNREKRRQSIVKNKNGLALIKD